MATPTIAPVPGATNPDPEVGKVRVERAKIAQDADPMKDGNLPLRPTRKPNEPTFGGGS